VGHDGQVTHSAADGEVALAVGPESGHTDPRQFVQQQRRRMAVVVVGAHADDRDRSVDGREELRVRVRRPVVRHLEDVGSQVGPGREQILLGLDLGVARQQDPNPVDLGAEHERGVVGVRPRAVVRERRRQHLQVYVADYERAADRRRLYDQTP
jgi:hypothetical protein